MMLSDDKLYALCKSYGEQLLPEVYSRRLYDKKGFRSIFEFAAKLAGLSEETVRRALNLEKRFAELPALKNLLAEGRVSLHKLARVASVATAENQDVLAVQVQQLPKAALEVLIRDVKPKNEEKSVPGHTELQLSESVKNKLLQLHQKGVDINALLEGFLAEREAQICEEKIEIAREMEAKGPMSRHIPAKVRRVLEKEFGKKCAVQGCQNDSKTIHHTARFSLTESHNPHYLAPLCDGHHKIAHSIDKNVIRKVNFWDDGLDG